MGHFRTTGSKAVRRKPNTGCCKIQPYVVDTKGREKAGGQQAERKQEFTGEANNMNKIYWDKDKITILTDQIEAVEHKHYAMQLFLGLEKELNIEVSGKMLNCNCILINQNICHSFSTGNRLHISIIIEPTSDFAEQLRVIMGENEYCIFDTTSRNDVVEHGYNLLHSDDLEIYRAFMQTLYHFLGIIENDRQFDDRIRELLHYIENCSCDEHSISSFANMVSLSSSRLSHLFREQVGIPLKSYIQLHQIQKAFLALLNGKNITEASMLADFDTPSHFAAVTKRMMGMPASLSLKNSVFLKVFHA